jgi:hypothetical protein
VAVTDLPPIAPQPVNDPNVEMAAMETPTIAIHTGPSIGSGSGPVVQMVNSHNLTIDFDVKGIGPSGLGGVDLWYTRNGQIWHKYPGPAQTKGPFVVEVAEDGLVGFTVVANNGVGLGKNPPLPGDPPQIWVEVDTVKPEVHLLNTQAGVDEAGRTLTLRWAATDKNLVPRPITLSYAEQAGGPWTPFATNLDNTGSYTWHMAASMPAQVLVRVEATDRIGNVGSDQSNMPTPLDLARPDANITHVGRNGTLEKTGQ